MQPPQNPYNQPGYGQGAPAPYGAPSPQQPRGTVSLDVIGEAWKLVQPNIGQWILGILIVGAVAFGRRTYRQRVANALPPATGAGAERTFLDGVCCRTNHQLCD